MAKGAVKLQNVGGRLVSTKSKTGNPACSQAMSEWVRGRKSGNVSSWVFAILGKCRAQARMLKMGGVHEAAGNAAKAQVLRARATRGLTASERAVKAEQLRGSRQAANPAQIRMSTPTKTIAKPSQLAAQVSAARTARGLDSTQRKGLAAYRRIERSNGIQARASLKQATATKVQPLIHTATGIEIKGEPGNAPQARISTARFTAARRAKAVILASSRAERARREAERARREAAAAGRRVPASTAPATAAQQFPVRGRTNRPTAAAPVRDAKPFGDHPQLGLSKAPATMTAGAKAVAEKFFGPNVTKQQLVSLAGAPDDATVDIVRGLDGETIVISVEHPGYKTQVRTIRQMPNGKIAIHNDHYVIHEGFQGTQHADPKYHNLAVRSTARQVETAHAMGVHQLDTYAMRSDPSGYVGYNVWPQHGFNGPIPSPVKAELQRSNLPARLKAAKNVGDLLKEQAGKDWWRERGDSADLVFGLDKGSYSMKHLHKYVQKRLGSGTMEGGGQTDG